MINDQSMRTTKVKVEEDSVQIDRMVNTIIKKYNRDLNNYMNEVHALLEESETLSDEEIERLCIKLPVFMYFSIGGLESLGIESDLAKAVKLEVYNEKYIRTEGTIKDKQAIAENDTFNEQLVEVAFLRAYKKLKSQIEKAEHVFSGAKKVLSKRMQDKELHDRDNYNN